MSFLVVLFGGWWCWPVRAVRFLPLLLLLSSLSLFFLMLLLLACLLFFVSVPGCCTQFIDWSSLLMFSFSYLLHPSSLSPSFSYSSSS